MGHDDEIQWEEHSINFVEMAYNMENRGRVENPDGYGIRKGKCGDTIEMFLTIEEGLIKDVTFDLDGCLNTSATGNTVAHLTEGKTVKSAWETTIEEVIVFLGTLPPDHYHCAELALGAFYLALSDYEKKA